MTPAVLAHADWGMDPRKRQVAVASLVGTGTGTGSDTGSGATASQHYRVIALAAAPNGGDGCCDLFDELATGHGPGQRLVGFDFTIGLPSAYAAAIGVESFPEFLAMIGSPPWAEFERVAERPGEISLYRPFYPDRPGGTQRDQLYAALGLSARELRRRCDGNDAETLFWTLGGKQAGKASLDGWRVLRRARARGVDIALWPFDGALPELLARPGLFAGPELLAGPGPPAGPRVASGTGPFACPTQFVVAEAYPREFYRCIGAPPRARWSKRRRADRLECIPSLLRWADSAEVSWDAGVLRRVAAGFSDGITGEDEFDAVIGLLGMISVVTGIIPAGDPPDDPAVRATEGWILGRAA